MNVDRDIAIAYLLGELDEADRRRFETEMAGDPSLRELVDGLAPVVGNLESLPPEAWDPPAPPPLDIVRVTAADGPSLPEREAELDREVRTHGAGGSIWLKVGGFLAAGAALLLVGFFIGSGTGDDGSSPSTTPPGTGEPFVLDSFGEAPASAAGEVQMVSSEGDQMRLDVSGLKPSPDGEFYELWLLGDEGELIALGSFRVGEEGNRSIQVPLPVDPGKFKYFDVSIQPENGDPAHSGRSVLRGLTSY